MTIDFGFEPTRQSKDFIFISYAHKDAERVAPYVYELHRRGYQVWYDRGINALESFKDVILKRISECSCFVAFISRNYANSSNCISETSLATTKNIQRLPVFIEKMDKLPDKLAYDISNVQYLYAYKHTPSEAVDIIANRAYKILTGQINDWSDWNDSRVSTSAPSQQNDECGKLVRAGHYWADYYMTNGGKENLENAKNEFERAKEIYPYDSRVWLGLIKCEICESNNLWMDTSAADKIGLYRTHIAANDTASAEEYRGLMDAFFGKVCNHIIAQRDCYFQYDISHKYSGMEGLTKDIAEFSGKYSAKAELRNLPGLAAIYQLQAEINSCFSAIRPEYELQLARDAEQKRIEEQKKLEEKEKQRAEEEEARKRQQIEQIKKWKRERRMDTTGLVMRVVFLVIGKAIVAVPIIIVILLVIMLAGANPFGLRGLFEQVLSGNSGDSFDIVRDMTFAIEDDGLATHYRLVTPCILITVALAWSMLLFKPMKYLSIGIAVAILIVGAAPGLIYSFTAGMDFFHLVEINIAMAIVMTVECVLIVSYHVNRADGEKGFKNWLYGSCIPIGMVFLATLFEAIFCIGTCICSGASEVFK